VTGPLAAARALYASCYSAAPSDPWLLWWSQDWLTANGRRSLEACDTRLLQAYTQELRVAFRQHRAELAAAGNPS
jgi:hypothetical protein